jgi:DNA-binding SARP family transcriptional activator
MSSRIREFINRGTVPLVGRERELRTLLEAFNSLLEGESRAVWLSGAAGAGKSRLLDEVKLRAREHATRSLVVHAKWYEGEGIELGPLSNALEVIRPVLAAPVASRIYRDGTITTVDAAVEAVQIASRRYPVVLILDDLHYLHSSTELERFIDALEEIPILLLATARPVENPALRALRSALAGSIPPLELEIGSLDGSAIAEAACELFGSHPPEEILGQIAALSAGLPLALREVFRELIAAGHVVEGETPASPWVWRSRSLSEEELRLIGERVHGFAGRLASLPPLERRILATAAYLGEQFNRDLLRSLMERSGSWEPESFERLILGGFVSVATPSIRLGLRDPEGRVCYAFMHTLLWKATLAAADAELPERSRLAAMTVSILSSGTGELYSVAPLEGLDAAALSPEDLDGLFTLLVGVGQRLSPIYSEAYISLCAATVEPARQDALGERLDGRLLERYLAVLASYGKRLYRTGMRERLQSIASEIATILDRVSVAPPAGVEERITRLEGTVIIWYDSALNGGPERARKYFDDLLPHLPPPSEQTDRELYGTVEAIRQLASFSFGRGDFASALDTVAPYLKEVERMRPETLVALLTVLFPAMMRTGRQAEAKALIDAGLRLRFEADPFTQYELLIIAANFARDRSDLATLRQYATEARTLIDRYPLYRNQSVNYWHLPYLAACAGDVTELMELENDFRATPPPRRSTPLQTSVARFQFLLAWNLLGLPDKALEFAGEIDRSVVDPRQVMRLSEEELRALIDAGRTDDIPPVLGSLDQILSRLGTPPPSSVPPPGSRTAVLRLLASSLMSELPEELRERITVMKPGEIEDVDAFRAARILLEAAEKAAGRKREYNDAAYSAIELGIEYAKKESAIGLGHCHLDRLSPLLPKTRLTKFRQMLGDDPRRKLQAASEEGDAEQIQSDIESQRTVRTFGALRIEGAGESGSKLESKTRSLVAAFVVAKLGDTRWIGELTRDRLAYLLWPDMSIDRAVNNLHATMSYARRFLGGSDTIVQHDGIYELGDDVRIDVVEFRESVTKGDRLHNEGIYFGAAVAYQCAVDLAEGDFLEGMYADWVDNVRESLRGELARALERLIAIEVDRDNFAVIPTFAERLLSLDDLHDGAYEALIRSAATRGARREAFGYFKRYEAALDSYGAGPARRITELMEKVRAGEVGA